MYESLYGHPPFVGSSVRVVRPSFNHTRLISRSDISPVEKCKLIILSVNSKLTVYRSLNWKDTLKFPPKPRLTAQCTDLMTKLLCEPENRLGSQPGIKPSILSVRSVLGLSGSEGLGSDGAEQIKAHPWFGGIDWDGECHSHGTITKMLKGGKRC